MSETTTAVRPTDRHALRELLDREVPVTVYFDGCPIPGELVGVYPDGDLDVRVHDEDGRQDGDHAVNPRQVIDISIG